jgi:hypothetical protein
MLISFWALTGLTRAEFGVPYSSRYLYVGALLAVLLTVELARGVPVGRAAMALIAVAVGAAIVSNAGALRNAGRLLRNQGRVTAADLGALQIGRPVARAGYVATGIPGYPFVVVEAAAYYSLARSLGTPAASPAQIARDPETVRAEADNELIHMHGAAPFADHAATTGGSPPGVDAVRGGAARTAGSCVRFTPTQFTPAGRSAALALTLPRRGLLLRAINGPANVAIRRFGDAFEPLGTLQPGGSSVLRIAPDLAPQPWHVEVGPTAGLVACGAG